MKPRLAVGNKQAAHSKWACFACRWVAKFTSGGVRATRRPSHVCPRCRTKMSSTGSAFRPPARTDDEGWQVAERFIALGYRYGVRRTRQALPRTRRELEAWLALAQQDDEWLPEGRIVLGRNRLGQPQWRLGRQVLADGERVMTWSAGAWHEATLTTRGDGGRILARPVVVLASTNQIRPVTAATRLRALKSTAH
jgi:hypothetical protein